MSEDVVTTGLLVEGVSHALGGRTVVENISFFLPKGGVACLIGPSGAGKTTLLGLIGGLSIPDEGAIRHSFLRPAFVFQDPRLLPWRTARGNVAFALSGSGFDRTRRRDRSRSMLVEVGLGAEDAAKYPHQLSGGMRKRVALARALAVEPDLLLLDEPFSALDFGLSRQLQALVRRLIGERGMTAVIVTHDLAEAVRLADRIVVLTRGPARVAAIHDLKRPPRLRDDSYVQAALDRLLAREDIRSAFEIEPKIVP